MSYEIEFYWFITYYISPFSTQTDRELQLYLFINLPFSPIGGVCVCLTLCVFVCTIFCSVRPVHSLSCTRFRLSFDTIIPIESFIRVFVCIWAQHRFAEVENHKSSPVKIDKRALLFYHCFIIFSLRSPIQALFIRTFAGNSRNNSSKGVVAPGRVKLQAR